MKRARHEERRRTAHQPCAARHSLVSAIAAVAAIGCANFETAAPSVVRTDSAGIGLVRISPAALEGVSRWTLSGSTLVIGGDYSDDASALHLAGHPVLLENGNIAVPNQQTEIRYYTPSGKLAEVSGRRGDGPGDYRRVLAVFRRPGDSLIVFDGFGPPYRVSSLNPAGRYVGARSVGVGSLSGALPAMLRDGSLVLVVRLRGAAAARIARGQLGASYDSVVLALVRPSGEVEHIASRRDAPVIVTGAGNWKTQRFAPTMLMGAAESTIAFAQTDRFEIQVFRSEGKLNLVISVAIKPTLVTPEIVARIDRSQLVDRNLVREGGTVGPPDDVAPSLPIIDRVRVDRAERVWVRCWSFPDETTSNWYVFGPDGSLRARIALPSGFDFRDAGENWIIGRIEDSDGVQSVRRYSIVQGSGTSSSPR